MLSVTVFNQEQSESVMKYTPAEQLFRKRERNKVHAKKTRERKRFQTVTLQTRINDLKEEGDRMRQLVDDRYMASSLLGLSQNCESSSIGDNIVKHSSEICRNYYVEVALEIMNENNKKEPIRRGARTGEKFSVEEKERRRRERNRMHARKTREKTRTSFELRGVIITEMTTEVEQLRTYLFNKGILSEEEVQTSILRDLTFRQENDHLLRSTPTRLPTIKRENSNQDDATESPRSKNDDDDDDNEDEEEDQDDYSSSEENENAVSSNSNEMWEHESNSSINSLQQHRWEHGSNSSFSV